MGIARALADFFLSMQFCQFWELQTLMLKKMHNMLYMLFLNNPKKVIKKEEIYRKKGIQSPEKFMSLRWNSLINITNMESVSDSTLKITSIAANLLYYILTLRKLPKFNLNNFLLWRFCGNEILLPQKFGWFAQNSTPGN